MHCPFLRLHLRHVAQSTTPAVLLEFSPMKELSRVVSSIPPSETLAVSDKAKALKEPADGALDEVHTARDLYQADLVALLIAQGNSGACGMAFQMTVLSGDFEDAAFGCLLYTSRCV